MSTSSPWNTLNLNLISFSNRRFKNVFTRMQLFFNFMKLTIAQIFIGYVIALLVSLFLSPHDTSYIVP